MIFVTALKLFLKNKTKTPNIFDHINKKEKINYKTMYSINSMNTFNLMNFLYILETC